MKQNPFPRHIPNVGCGFDYLTHIHTSAIDLVLDRVQAVANKALSPNQPYRYHSCRNQRQGFYLCSINGKYSSRCWLFGRCLQFSHLIRYNERVRVNGVDARDEQHTEAFAYIEQQRGEIISA